MEIVKCIVKNKGLHPLEPVKIQDFCALYADGTHIEMKLSEWESGRSENASRYFHKLRDRYGETLGYSRPAAKIELKYLWGIHLPYDESFEPPKWAGEFVELYNKIIFIKSTTEYTKREMGALIEGTVSSCMEAQVYIDDLVKDYEGRRAVP